MISLNSSLSMCYFICRLLSYRIEEVVASIEKFPYLLWKLKKKGISCKKRDQVQ